MAPRAAYKALKPVQKERMLEEEEKNLRLKESHETQFAQLKEKARAVEGVVTKAEGAIFTLIRARRDAAPMYELKSGELTLEAPEKQGDLPLEE